MGDSRRSYGTGTLYRRSDAHGRDWWYGRWHNGTSRPNRKIGPIRTRGDEEGLTRREAEQALRKLIDAEQPKYAGPRSWSPRPVSAFCGISRRRA
jgi:hypothetical protein